MKKCFAIKNKRSFFIRLWKPWQAIYLDKMKQTRSMCFNIYPFRFLFYI